MWDTEMNRRVEWGLTNSLGSEPRLFLPSPSLWLKGRYTCRKLGKGSPATVQDGGCSSSPPTPGLSQTLTGLPPQGFGQTHVWPRQEARPASRRRLTSPKVPSIHKSFLGRRMVQADTTLENSEGPTVSGGGAWGSHYACKCNQKRKAGVTGPLTPCSYSFPSGNLQGTAVICHPNYPFPSLSPYFSQRLLPNHLGVVHSAYKLILVLHCPQGNTQTYLGDVQAQAQDSVLPFRAPQWFSCSALLWPYCHLWCLIWGSPT